MVFVSVLARLLMVFSLPKQRLCYFGSFTFTVVILARPSVKQDSMAPRDSGVATGLFLVPQRVNLGVFLSHRLFGTRRNKEKARCLLLFAGGREREMFPCLKLEFCCLHYRNTQTGWLAGWVLRCCSLSETCAGRTRTPRIPRAITKDTGKTLWGFVVPEKSSQGKG